MADRVAGVILAAGYSSRMSRFKPLCPIGNEALVDRIIRIFREGGVEDIYGVTGFQRELLEERLLKQNVRPLFNPRFDEGMYSSVRTAVTALSESGSAFLMLPVDYPFVLPETIALLTGAFRESSADVIFPVCQGRKGHPPLISGTLFKDILDHDGEGGLRAVLNRDCYHKEYRETGDEGILYDADDDETLARLREKFADRIGQGSPE